MGLSDKETLPVSVPEVLLDEEHPDRVYQNRPTVEQEVSIEGVVELASNVQLRLTNIGYTEIQRPLLHIIREDLNVCPQSFITVDIADMLALQSNCEEYHIPPYAPVWFHNPNVVIEAFESIKQGKNMAWRVKRLKEANKAQQPPTSNKLKDLVK